MNYELLIQDIRIIDGSGGRPFYGCVGCRDGKLKIMDPHCNAGAERIIDGRGLCVSPGFIDAHSHGDLCLGAREQIISKLSQGITTEVVGQCGFSMFPINPDRLELHQSAMASLTGVVPEEMAEFTSFERYLEYVNTINLGTNIAFLVGHVTLRAAVMGADCRAPSTAELDLMKKMLREAMEQGAIGISTGLIYIPSVYSKTEELIELCKVVKEYGGIYTTHMRNETNNLAGALKEALEVGRKTGVRLHISHLKVCGKENWGMSVQILDMIKSAREEGLSVTCDMYPYSAAMTHLTSCIPPQYSACGMTDLLNTIADPEMRRQIKDDIQSGKIDYENLYQSCGGFSNIFVNHAPLHPEAEGMTVAEYANRNHFADVFDAFYDIILSCGGAATGIFPHIGIEDMNRILLDPYTVIGSDGTVFPESPNTHPRTYGAFPKAIRYFVKEKHLLPLEKMIEKMTSLTAGIYGIRGKGMVRDGYDADLAVYSLDEVKDCASYLKPDRLAEGMRYVIVGGKVVMEKNHLQHRPSGSVLCHQINGVGLN